MMVASFDRVDRAYNTLTISTHEKMPGLLYSAAAADGCFESYDYGQS
jgi:hypothetical protein